ncbi:claudin-2-like [Hemiscyllium ocellatum]|uniref:claudin-2-like n=1 Tax=Hemiscyllium ocellatum TaxID=170820 RepID=UPI002967436B|nr:claudin-2-like [Hemiscyllium ocellatum]
MANTAIQLVALIVCIIGMVGTLSATIMPHWRITAHIGANVVTAIVYMKGLWWACAMFSTGVFQCETYNSVLELPADLQTARAMMVISVGLSLLAITISVVGMKCTVCAKDSPIKDKVAGTGGVFFIIAGLAGLVPVAWTMNGVILNFNNPLIPGDLKFEIGESLYLGVVAAMLSVIGGVMLSLSFIGRRTEPYSRRPMSYQNPAANRPVPAPSAATVQSKAAKSEFNSYNLTGYV